MKVPAELGVVVKLVPLPVEGVPPVAVHANVYGVVPPVAEAVHVKAVPTVPVVGQTIEAWSGSAEIVTVAVCVCVLAVGVAESVPVTDIV